MYEILSYIGTFLLIYISIELFLRLVLKTTDFYDHPVFPALAAVALPATALPSLSMIQPGA